MLELYTDYLMSSFGYTTSTGLSNLLDGSISHDKITRFLSKEQFSSKDLWHLAKPIIRKIESSEGVLIFDDSIEEKPYTDENDIICYHYDHCQGRSIKGINFLTALYYNKEMSIPVSFQIISKTEKVIDKSGKETRKSLKSKNEYLREMLKSCIQNKIKFRYVLSDVWFASSENMNYIHKDLSYDFVMPLKSNRKISLTKQDKKKGKYQSISTVDLESNTVQEIYLEGVEFPMLLAKQVFTNGDGSNGILYLVTSDIQLDYTQITIIYKKRWKIEEYHKSLKQNASLEKSPTRTIITQSNHFFACLYSFIKLESLKSVTKLNHFALRTKIYISATKQAFNELKKIEANYQYLVTCVT